MTLLPALIVDTRPLEPAALLTTATAPSDEVHVTCVVRSCVELSVYRPVAVNRAAVPAATLIAPGVTSIDLNVGALAACGWLFGLGGGCVVSLP
jgi:hypothetical protein